MYQPRQSIWVSDFGYGATGGVKQPKDDYDGLAAIFNEMLAHFERSTSSATDKQILRETKESLTKLLREPAGAERRPPLALLQVLAEIKQTAQKGGSRTRAQSAYTGSGEVSAQPVSDSHNVGSFQVAEMIGERWEWWRRLFVPTVPARSKILSLDIPTVVTGPRGCGKTMLLRRLSERLIVECGEVAGLASAGSFAAFYVNANDIGDAFSRFPDQPDAPDEARLVCYANVCVLADVLAVQSALMGQSDERPTDALLRHLQGWLAGDGERPLVVGEDRLERYRTTLEQIKWKFPGHGKERLFPGYAEMSQHRWLPHFFQTAQDFCPWLRGRPILLFVDDYSTPRISAPMQRVLNRLFLQRSPYFLSKLATEAAGTFVSEDSSGKNLEDGDDYQLVDLGEESLFLQEAERAAFLNEVFSRRLEADARVPRQDFSLRALLGRLNLSKTEFARRLREPPALAAPKAVAVPGTSQRRGRSRPRVLYHGAEVFTCLWSGDTRTMIQLITDVVDRASATTVPGGVSGQIALPIPASDQDLVFRNRGGEWLSSHERNQPTHPDRVKAALDQVRTTDGTYRLSGEYGQHLKAVVEAFVAAARKLLLGPTYHIREGNHSDKPREVPRMAFRIEIVDEFRIDGLAREIYHDLVRYGLFIRDSRGKSVRGTFVPRLFLRRLLLPYGTLALSKRDSVPLKCEEFSLLLLKPDVFKASFVVTPGVTPAVTSQLMLALFDRPPLVVPDAAYDDLEDSDGVDGDAEVSPTDEGGGDEEEV
jgi:hypothetical protein